MTDIEIITAIGAVLGAGGLGGALRWAVGRIVRSNDAGTAALVEIAASNAVLVTKIDEMRNEMREVNSWVRSHVTLAQPNMRVPTLGRGEIRTKTPGLGVRTHDGSHDDSED